MGRGRGRGKKNTVVVSHEELASGGEEVIVAYRRRGRPQKIFKDDVNEEKAEKREAEEEDGDDVKATLSSKEVKSPRGKKRKMHPQAKENSDSNLEENDTSAKSSIEESTTSNGYRQKGSRRKGIPRRAAEAGVKCNSLDNCPYWF